MTTLKQLIRRNISEHKKALSGQIITELSKKICDRVVQTEAFQKASCVALYYAMDDEVCTSGIIDEWHKKKTIALPVTSGENINFYEYTKNKDLTKGAFGIPEPVSGKIIPCESIDLFIVPGIAFDSSCSRLGRGKGYYDRYLSDVKKPIIGICFDFQLIDSVPTEKHDMKMTMVITENVIVSSHHQ